ncbi:MAG: hemolysin-type calcium-binding protein, partial [Pseudomonadota bacterium]
MKSLVTKLAILPLAIASTIAMAGTNLVENGSFENTDTVTDHNGQWQLFYEIPGWTRSSNARFEIQTNKLGIVPAQDGEQHIELDSRSNYSITQALATTAGKKYELSF